MDSSTNNVKEAASTSSQPQPTVISDDKRCNEDDNNQKNNDPSASSSTQQNNLPIEYQLYEVDLSNPDMDPLEYTFPKYIPIPKVYYWDTTTSNNDDDDETIRTNANELPMRIKLWHNSIYYLGICLQKAEAGGEVVANILGLNSGPFNWVTENMTRREMEQSQVIVNSRREEQVELEQRKEGDGV